jgi:hypothetical protein
VAATNRGCPAGAPVGSRRLPPPCEAATRETRASWQRHVFSVLHGEAPIRQVP